MAVDRNSEARFSVEKFCLGSKRGSSHSQEQEEQEEVREHEEQEEQKELEEVEEASRPRRPGVGRTVGPHRFGKLVEAGGSLPNQHHLQFSIKSHLTKDILWRKRQKYDIQLWIRNRL